MRMIDREKVITGLELCTDISQDGCMMLCPYRNEQDETYSGFCEQVLKRDALALLKEQEPQWVSVKDRLPVETHSIFWPWYGRKEWSNAMWREQSDKVLVTVTFKDGTCLVTTGETHDGEWHTSISKTLNPIVTHWMQMPEPPKEGR